MKDKQHTFYVDLYCKKEKLKEINTFRDERGAETRGECLRQAYRIYSQLFLYRYAQNCQMFLVSRSTKQEDLLLESRNGTRIMLAGKDVDLLDGHLFDWQKDGFHIDIIVDTAINDLLSVEQEFYGFREKGAVLLLAYNFSQFLYQQKREYEVLLIRDNSGGVLYILPLKFL